MNADGYVRERMRLDNELINAQRKSNIFDGEFTFIFLPKSKKCTIMISFNLNYHNEKPFWTLVLKDNGKRCSDPFNNKIENIDMLDIDELQLYIDIKRESQKWCNGEIDSFPPENLKEFMRQSSV